MSGVDSGRIGLDVFHDNVRALKWYSRLGFATIAAAEFLELAAPGRTGEEPVYVTGLPQADLCQERFGFSRFALITRQGTFNAGRIGDTWFRLTDLEAVRSAAVFAALERLDPQRRVFAVLPAFSAPPNQVVRVMAKAQRMEAEISLVMSSLSDAFQESRRFV
jgi:hypothetical protein